MKKTIFFFCLFAMFANGAEKKVCLNMIVKNESPVITRCLETVKDQIDYWVIVDTGSTDGTQEIIKEFMKDIPGKLYERPWVNFAHNRNQALRLAKGKGDYILMIDADEMLEGKFDKKSLTADIYLGTLRTSSNPLTTSLRALLVNNHLDWRWEGVIHEQLRCSRDVQMETLPYMVVDAEARDGHRTQDPEKFLKDAQVLEKALIDEPNNSDYVYYLAQSYFNAKNFELALKYYQKRSKMDGWDQYTFWSKYYTGFIQEMLEMDSKQIIQSYCDAYQFRPTRVEPLCRLANYFYNQKNYLLGYMIAQFGKDIPIPNDIVYVEKWIYSYGLLAVLANCALELGKHEEAMSFYEKICQNTDIPEMIFQQAQSTIRFLKNQKPTPPLPTHP